MAANVDGGHEVDANINVLAQMPPEMQLRQFGQGCCWLCCATAAAAAAVAAAAFAAPPAAAALVAARAVAGIATVIWLHRVLC